MPGHFRSSHYLGGFVFSIKKGGAIAAAVIGFGAGSLVALPAANATQLHDTTNSIGCKEVKLSQKQKVQFCEHVLLQETGGTSDYVNAAADATAYKLVSGQWVQDDSVQVSVNSVQLFVGGVGYGGQAYPSGPQSGRAYGVTRGNSNLYRGQDNSAYAKATFGVWKDGAEVRSVSQQGPTTVIPALGNGQVGGGYDHPNADNSLVCTFVALNATHQLRGCVSAGVNGVGDVVAYKKVNGEWVEDASKQVSVNSVVNTIDGAQSGGQAYPSGPQAGKARAATRGVPSLDPTVSHTTSAVATFGYWQNGQQVATASLASNLGTIPAAI
jgi:hypothetical protein